MTTPGHLTSPLPRRLPFQVYPLALFDSAFALFGWFFFAFSFPMFWFIFSRSPLFDAPHFLGPLARTSGAVISSTDTGTVSNNETVYAVKFRYTPQGGEEPLVGTAYTSGDRAATGQTVSVEYRTDHPAYARVQGMRTAEMDDIVILFAAIFPLVGLGLMLTKIIPGLRGLALLRRGLPARATITMVDKSDIKVNHRRLLWIYFRFVTPDGRKGHLRHLSGDPKSDWLFFKENEGVDPERFPEVILYDPVNLNRAVLPAGVATGLTADMQGNLSGGRVGKAIAVSLLPLLVLAETVALFTLIHP